MKKLASNPRFKEAEKSGRAYVIPGVKPDKDLFPLVGRRSCGAARPMRFIALIAVLTLATITAASAQNQTTVRDASGRTRYGVDRQQWAPRHSVMAAAG